MSESAKIVLYGENNDSLELFVIEETKINNVHYLLAADSDDDGAEAYILKDTSGEEDPDAVYEIVEDGAEIAYIGKIFAELLDEDDIGLE